MICAFGFGFGLGGRGRAGAGAPPNPYAPLLDNYNDVDGTTLNAHISDSGHTWQNATGFTPATPTDIQALRVRGRDASGVHRSSAAMADGDGAAEIQIDALSNLAGDNVGVILRALSGANTFMMGRWLNGSFSFVKFLANTGSGPGGVYADAFTSGSRLLRFHARRKVFRIDVDGDARAFCIDPDIVGPGFYGLANGNAQGPATGRQIKAYRTMAAKEMFGDDCIFANGNIIVQNPSFWQQFGAIDGAQSTYASNQISSGSVGATGNVYLSPDIGTSRQGVSVDMKGFTAGSGPFVITNVIDANNWIGWRCTAANTIQVHVRSGSTFFQQSTDIAAVGASSSTLALEYDAATAAYAMRQNGAVVRSGTASPVLAASTRSGLNARGANLSPWIKNYVNYAL